jgi:hypothetical protein
VPRDQPQPGSFLHKREEPGNEVDDRDFQRPINRWNVDNDYNYSEESEESFIFESNGGISVFIAYTEPKIWNF